MWNQRYPSKRTWLFICCSLSITIMSRMGTSVPIWTMLKFHEEGQCKWIDILAYKGSVGQGTNPCQGISQASSTGSMMQRGNMTIPSLFLGSQRPWPTTWVTFNTWQGGTSTKRHGWLLIAKQAPFHHRKYGTQHWLTWTLRIPFQL